MPPLLEQPKNTALIFASCLILVTVLTREGCNSCPSSSRNASRLLLWCWLLYETYCRVHSHPVSRGLLVHIILGPHNLQANEMSHGFEDRPSSGWSRQAFEGMATDDKLGQYFTPDTLLGHTHLAAFKPNAICIRSPSSPGRLASVLIST